MALSYAPTERRAAVQALLDLDQVLGGILRSTREPLIGQMRLTWWYDALRALDEQRPPAEPALAALALHVLPQGVAGATLASMVDGWEMLLCDPLTMDEVRRFGTERGAGLFRAAAAVLGATDEAIIAAGEGWALADLSRNLGDARLAVQVRALASERLVAAFSRRWSRPARSLGALALLARADLTGVPIGSPRRVARLLRHRFTGR